MALALVGGIIHYHEQSLGIGALPGKSHEAIPCPVAVPGRNAFEQLPVAVANNRIAQHRKQPIVELLKLLIDRLLWPANQMRRDAFLSPFELSLVKEAQPGR